MFQHLQQQICNKQLQSWNGPNHQKKKQSRTKTFAKTKIQMIKNWSRWEFSEIKIYFHFKSDLAFCPQLNNLQPTLEDYFPVFASVWSYFMAIEWTVNKMNQDLRSPTFSKVAEVCFWFALQYILSKKKCAKWICFRWFWTQSQIFRELPYAILRNQIPLVLSLWWWCLASS